MGLMMKVFKKKILCYTRKILKELTIWIFRFLSQWLTKVLFWRNKVLRIWTRFRFDKQILLFKCTKRISLSRHQYVMKYIVKMFKELECQDSIWCNHHRKKIEQKQLISLQILYIHCKKNVWQYTLRLKSH